MPMSMGISPSSLTFSCPDLTIVVQTVYNGLYNRQRGQCLKNLQNYAARFLVAVVLIHLSVKWLNIVPVIYFNLN